MMGIEQYLNNIWTMFEQYLNLLYLYLHKAFDLISQGGALSEMCVLVHNVAVLAKLLRL